MDDEKQLIKRIVSGDKAVFAEFVKQYQRLVCHIVFKIIYNNNDREDVCQEVFLRVFKHLKKFNYQSKMSTWIGTIAYNCSITFLEKIAKHKHDDLDILEIDNELLNDTKAKPDMVMENNEINGFIRSEIDKMPVKYRTIISLYHLEEMNYAEIGDITGLPAGTVKSHLFRARKLLKEQLQERFTMEEIWK